MTPEQQDDLKQTIKFAVEVLAEKAELTAQMKEHANHAKDVHEIPTKQFNRAVKIIYDASEDAESEFLESVLDLIKKAGV